METKTESELIGELVGVGMILASEALASQMGELAVSLRRIMGLKDPITEPEVAVTARVVGTLLLSLTLGRAGELYDITTPHFRELLAQASQLSELNCQCPKHTAAREAEAANG